MEQRRIWDGPGRAEALQFRARPGPDLFVMRAHEQLRAALSHRINRGTMTLSLLHRKTGIGCSHLSNFRHGHRALSVESFDAIARALGFDAELVPIADPRISQSARPARLPVPKP